MLRFPKLFEEEVLSKHGIEWFEKKTIFDSGISWKTGGGYCMSRYWSENKVVSLYELAGIALEAIKETYSVQIEDNWYTFGSLSGYGEFEVQCGNFCCAIFKAISKIYE